MPEAVELLRRAGDAWGTLGRPLDAARCELLIGHRLREEDPGAACDALRAAAETYENLGVHHLAEGARALATV
jgi:hypothetical protein